jgi:hypothetical protein
MRPFVTSLCGLTLITARSLTGYWFLRPELILVHGALSSIVYAALS